MPSTQIGKSLSPSTHDRSRDNSDNASTPLASNKPTKNQIGTMCRLSMPGGLRVVATVMASTMRSAKCMDWNTMILVLPGASLGEAKNSKERVSKRWMHCSNPSGYTMPYLLTKPRIFHRRSCACVMSYSSPPKRLIYAYDELQNLNTQSLPAPEEIFGNKRRWYSACSFHGRSTREA